MPREAGEVYYDMLKLITFKREQFRSKADLGRALGISRQRVQQLILKALTRGDMLDDPFGYNEAMIRRGGKSRYPGRGDKKCA